MSGRQTGLFLLTTFSIVLLSGCATAPPHSERPLGSAAPGADREPGPEAARWVDETLTSLTIREKAAQLLFPWIRGGYVSTESAEFDSLSARVEEGLGGVNISIGLPHAYVARLNALQRRARVPLLVTSDFESAGPGRRLAGSYALPSLLSLGGGTDLPPTMAFGAIGEERFAFEAGRITGVEARAVGVHLAFAPVADVNSNPENPIINTRSFGEDPERVGRLAAAFIRGARSAGLLTTAKHFPGHGDTRTDSHLELPSIAADRSRLDTLELVPFRHAVEAGVDGVMTAHIALPDLLGADSPPATLSARILQGLLREEMGFGGLIVTDALGMAALADRFEAGELAVRALEAGADVLLSPPDVGAAMGAITRAVESGRVPESRLDRSVRRVLRAKARAGLHEGRRLDLEAVDEVVGRRTHAAFADTAAARSITVPRDREALLPLDTARVRRVLSVTFARGADPAAGRAFDGRLSRAVARVDTVRVGERTSKIAYDSIAARADSADLVLLSSHVAPTAGEGSVDLPEPFTDFARRLMDGDAPVAALSFGSPYLLSALPDVGTYLLAWGGREVSQRAAARAVLGEAPVTGRLPIALPPHHRVGEGLRRPVDPERIPATVGREAPAAAAGMDSAALARVDRLIRTAVVDSVTPGAALAVGRHGRLVRMRGYGRLDWKPDAPLVTDSTLYDVASLTKVLGTTAAVMRLAGEGRLSPDDPVGRHLPEWRQGWKAEVTLRQLLLHRGGLEPFRPFWQELRGRAAYRDAIAGLEEVYTPGDSTVYSDLGFITLGFVAEAVSGLPLDRYLDRYVYGPLGLRETGFAPSPSLLSRIAPTEVDTVFRHAHVRGSVHDENAHALGGVAGHAGLFSSARDLAKVAEDLLDAPPEFAVRHDSASHRALGWETPGPRSSAGAYLGRHAFGHTGFTGTSLWVDPGLDLFVVLLTNRVNPTREERGHVPLRRAVHDAVARAVRDRTVLRRGEERGPLKRAGGTSGEDPVEDARPSRGREEGRAPDPT